MGNNSTLLTTVKEWMESLGLTTASPIIVVLLIMIFFIVILTLLALVFRRTRLWYWKVNLEVKTLQSIDSRLKNVEEGLLQNACQNAGTEIGNPESANDTMNETGDNGVNRADNDVLQIKSRNVGKSGRVYTEEELELLIRE